MNKGSKVLLHEIANQNDLVVQNITLMNIK